MPPQNSSIFTKTTHWYSRFERPISSLSLIGGFIFDALTLKRVDMFWENVWVVVHLLVVALCIILINRTNHTPEEEKDPEKLHFWLLNALQFVFGGLLSTFLVFYFRSGSFLVSWPFLLLLALAFIANERLKHHFARVGFQISFFYLSLFSFSIFLIPVLLHEIGTKIFLISGVASLIVLTFFLLLLRKLARDTFLESKKVVRISVATIFLVFNFLYFFNLIPPIPLSLKDAGIYHSLVKNTDGAYTAEREQTTWKNYFQMYDDVHTLSPETLYAYSAIFSPPALNTNIVHEWQKYSDSTNSWVTMSSVSLPVVGGRDGGYRTYSTRENPEQGKWRVNIETPHGQIIGRIYFAVSHTQTEPTLITETKN
jgi:hypothetical protein